MTYGSLLIFTATTAVSCFAPGPAALFVASSVATNGKRFILACVGGIVIANLIYFLAAAMGIAGVILAYPKLYASLRLIGAAYLAYLGFTLIRSRGGDLTAHDGSTVRSTLRASFAKALLIEISNPKALLYFSALLPQFINAREPIAGQLIVFSSITVVLDIASYTCYGLLGAFSAKAASARAINVFKKGAGILFVMVSARLALGG
jgi:homoserine/homoserine lactone efflux protein